MGRGGGRCGGPRGGDVVGRGACGRLFWGCVCLVILLSSSSRWSEKEILAASRGSVVWHHCLSRNSRVTGITTNGTLARILSPTPFCSNKSLIAAHANKLNCSFSSAMPSNSAGK